MKRSICIACLVGCLAAAMVPAWPADRAVPGTYSTIAAAMAAAQPGDRIVITGQHVENGLVNVSVNNLTITSGATRADLRETRFAVSAQNVTFQGVDINGNSVAGARSTTAQDLVLLEGTSSNVTFDDCKIINPATGEGDGGAADTNPAQHSNPGTCIEVRTPGPLTIRNCDFVCEDYTEGTGAQNIVNLHFRNAINAVGPVLIENTAFAAEKRNIDFQAGWSNITVRNCTFRNYGTGAGSAAGVYLFPDDADPEGVIRNLLIEGCSFVGNGIGARGIYCPSARTENVVIRNCSFISANMANAIRWIGRGEGPVIDNCVMRIGTRQGIGGTGGFAGEVFYPKGDPRGFIHGFVVRNCVIDGNDNAGIVFEWNVVDGIVIENNTLVDTGREGIGFFEEPCSVLVRGNHITRCGQSTDFVGTANGGIVLAVNDSGVTDTFIISCPSGIIPRWSRGARGIHRLRKPSGIRAI
ncbi:right-handed parallel beta-helix repeat-containing protein [bacterium]|nr:right-handed parallel beta-helix repeat-containing protein [bacterium]